MLELIEPSGEIRLLDVKFQLSCRDDILIVAYNTKERFGRKKISLIQERAIRAFMEEHRND
jgi:hypothetical protein